MEDLMALIAEIAVALLIIGFTRAQVFAKWPAYEAEATDKVNTELMKPPKYYTLSGSFNLYRAYYLAIHFSIFLFIYFFAPHLFSSIAVLKENILQEGIFAYQEVNQVSVAIAFSFVYVSVLKIPWVKHSEAHLIGSLQNMALIPRCMQDLKLQLKKLDIRLFVLAYLFWPPEHR